MKGKKRKEKKREEKRREKRGNTQWAAKIIYVHSTTIWDVPILVGKRQKIVHQAFRSVHHRADKKAFDNPKRVPVIRFAKPSARHNQPFLRRKERMLLWIASLLAMMMMLLVLLLNKRNEVTFIFGQNCKQAHKCAHATGKQYAYTAHCSHHSYGTVPSTQYVPRLARALFRAPSTTC